MTSIQDYVAVTGEDVIDRLHQLARPLRGMKVVHVNSTYVGGGVAEILSKLVPLQMMMVRLPLAADWPSWAVEQAGTVGLSCVVCGYDLRNRDEERRAAYQTGPVSAGGRLTLTCGPCLNVSGSGREPVDG